MNQTEKEARYAQVADQSRHLLKGESDLVAGCANVFALLKEHFRFWWVGAYFVKKEGENDVLVLGPFQGPIACSRIAFGKGVCGSSWKEKKSFLVPDVHLFPGHIACNEHSRSELVVPVFDAQQNVRMLIDIDSERVDNFSSSDLKGVENIARIIEAQFFAA